MKCIADVGIEKYLKDTKEFEVGLLIGQVVGKLGSDVILTAVPTPPETHDSPLNKLQDLSIEWMMLHAKQVLAWLPGGIDCIGVYIATKEDPTQVFTAVQLYLRALDDIKRSLNWLQDARDEWSTMYVVVSTTGGSISSRVAYKDHIPQTPVETKWQSTAGILQRFTASVELHQEFATTSDAVVANLRARLIHQAKQVEDALAVPGDDSNTVIFLSRPGHDDLPSSSKAKSSAVAVLLGGISCVAYVPAKAKQHHVAAAYLKQDFLKSVAIRMDLLDEDLAHNDCNTSSPRTNFVLARRASFPWISCGIASDFTGLVHALPGETLGECQSNVCEFLSSSIDDVAMSWLEDEPTTTADDDIDTSEEKKSVDAPPMYLLTALAVLLVALALLVLDVV
ncbi:hypothetical protein LEN26_011402 [Aphanomyces euteiches]|nr:hypothetical protein AeMF1_020692 [Aphanomyces euteiches]KAH9119822.1 hypothetical protein LEN26_011402 [Aphanomyces euteiches]KAH9195458.1 hypothetical protein AeNC1_002553 [Aphanomyces euteiches]